MIKLNVLMRRKLHLTHDEFVDHHKNVHAALFMSLPVVQQHVRRYVQQHTVDVTIPGPPPTTVDGITELWFDDLASLVAVFTDPGYLEQIRPDEMSFIDIEHAEFIITVENPVYP